MNSRCARGLTAIALLMVMSGAAQDPPVIRVDVKLVRILATVKTQTGNLVGGLKREEFEVYDSGVPQEIAVFETQTDQPVSVALLVDASGSTAKDLKSEAESATRFLKTLLTGGNSRDRVALYSFNWQVARHGDYSRNYKGMESDLKELRGEAGTSLYDAIYLAARDLEGRDGRKIMIIVTDGGDTTSSKTLKQAVEAAHLADAVIYPIVVIPITNDAGRNIGGENALTFIADATGGRTFLASLGAGLDRAFTGIIAELRTQYLLGYYPRSVPSTKDRFHKVEVRAKRQSLRVSARNGYFSD